MGVIPYIERDNYFRLLAKNQQQSRALFQVLKNYHGKEYQGKQTISLLPQWGIQLPTKPT